MNSVVVQVFVAIVVNSGPPHWDYTIRTASRCVGGHCLCSLVFPRPSFMPWFHVAVCSGFNSSEMQVLYGPFVDNSQISMQTDSQTQYLACVCVRTNICGGAMRADPLFGVHRPQPYYFGYQSPKYPIDKQFHPGFMSYQVQRTRCACVARVDDGRCCVPLPFHVFAAFHGSFHPESVLPTL